MVKIEMHYINSTDAPEEASATVEFYASDPSTIHDEAGILFNGSPDITIPANGSFTLHQFFTVPSYLDLSTSHIFAITGHEHHYGTNVQVNVAPSKAGPMTPVYSPDPFVWSEPVTENQNPDFSVPKNGGFDFTCDWVNTSNAEVKFGESANDEMCFFWAYYWPSQGSKVCFHTDQYGGANGLDLCCPGDSLCSLIQNQF
jgi:Copper type II ascorbate-dependent monooxygenase, C-terminal domain